MGPYGERLPSNTNNNETTENVEIILVKSQQHFNSIANVPICDSEVQYKTIGYVPKIFDNLAENNLPLFTTEVVESSVEITKPSRKKRCRKGKEYPNSCNQIKPKKCDRNKKDCSNKCRNTCAKKIMVSERIDQFKKFYKINCKDERRRFLLETTERKFINGITKKYNFFYYMKVAGVRIKVCKQYYLGTYDITQKTIYNAYNYNSNSNRVPS